MMDKDARILRLIEKIDSGKVSGDEAARMFDQIYKNSGETEIIYDVNDRTDQAYYKELFSNAKIGIYNRKSLIRMAEINYKGKSSVDKKVLFAIGGAVVLVIIAIIIIMTTGGES